MGTASPVEKVASPNAMQHQKEPLPFVLLVEQLYKQQQKHREQQANQYLGKASTDGICSALPLYGGGIYAKIWIK